VSGEDDWLEAAYEERTELLDNQRDFEEERYNWLEAAYEERTELLDNQRDFEEERYNAWLMTGGDEGEEE
jgi:hypothetical protein